MARTDPRPNYGAKRRVGAGGYIDLWRPGHPLARRDGYVAEHRFVLHQAGIAIPPRHHVHHVNRDRTDNRIENLAVVPVDEHARLHAGDHRQQSCPQGHEFTPSNTAFKPSGWRYCKQCNRDRVRRYKQRRKRAVLVVEGRR